MPSYPELIILVGPMGVGKTTIGKKLAKAMKVPFVDTDALVTSLHGPIDTFFLQHGEATFREVESDALAAAMGNPGVIATGGGAVLSEESRSRMANATVVYLSTDGRHMASRLSRGNRPLIKNGIDDWQRIYDSRKPLYEMVADVVIDTSDLPLAKIIAEILERLEKK